MREPQAWQRKFYNSRAWRRLRAWVIARDNGICQYCGEMIIDPPEVHHKTELTEQNYTDPAINLNPDLLITVHLECHNEIHKRFGCYEKETIVNDDLSIDYTRSEYLRIPFTNYHVRLERREKGMSITFTDERTGLPVSFDSRISKFDLNRRTPILENIYDTIATEFSKIDLLLVKDSYDESEESEKHSYKALRNHDNSKPLTLRPNMLQTKSELLYTIAYQLHAYRNALVRIVRKPDADKNIVLALEPIDCNDYLFGQAMKSAARCT